MYRIENAPLIQFLASSEVRTWGQALLELLGLLGVLEDKSVLVAVAPDLELDLVGLAVLLYTGGCRKENVSDSVAENLVPIAPNVVPRWRQLPLEGN